MSEKLIGVTVRLPESIWRAYYEKALRTRQSVSSIITQFLLSGTQSYTEEPNNEKPNTLHNIANITGSPSVQSILRQPADSN